VLLESFPVSLGVVVGVVAAVTGAFALSLPMLRSPIDSAMLGTPEQPRYAVAHVRRVFAEYGVRLHYTSHPRRGVVVLGVIPPPYPPTALTVTVPAGGGFAARYGGSNSRVRARVAAAVAALRRR
jgi:hypothetical protein